MRTIGYAGRGGTETGFGGAAIGARGHVPLPTAPRRIGTRDWSVRSPWAGAERDPAAERAALVVTAKRVREEIRRGGGRDAASLVAHREALRARRNVRLRTVPPEKWSARPTYLAPERAEVAQRLVDEVVQGVSVALASERLGVSESAAEKWLQRGWTTTPLERRPRRPSAVPMTAAQRVAVEAAARLVAEEGLGRREAAARAGASLRRLREHLGPPTPVVPKKAPPTRTGEQVRAEAEQRRAEALRLIRTEGLSVRQAAIRAGTSARLLRDLVKSQG